MKQTELLRYLWQAQNCLDCSPAHRWEFIVFVRRSLAEIAAENPQADFAVCAALFGTPRSTAEQFMAGLPPREVEAWRRYRTLARWLAVAGAAVVIAALAWLCVYLYRIGGVVKVIVQTYIAA